MDYKERLIHNLLLRANNICTDNVTLQNEIQFLKSTWQRNSFPLFLLATVSKMS